MAVLSKEMLGNVLRKVLHRLVVTEAMLGQVVQSVLNLFCQRNMN